MASHLCRQTRLSSKIFAETSARTYNITAAFLGQRSVPKLFNKIASDDVRVREFGNAYQDEFTTIREKYQSPKNPLVLCHGLLGFDTIRIGGIESLNIPPLAIVHYWKGIKEALEAKGIEVFITRVPRTGSLEQRAEVLAKQIEERFQGREVNLIGHSMGGLDCRYLISNLKPNATIRSLTTIATPHRGSPFADYCLSFIGDTRLPALYNALKRLKVEAGAFEQLTTTYMQDSFNPRTPDDPHVRYFSFGSYFNPNRFSVFRTPWRIIHVKEGPNDGLVSVASARWGEYKGTLVDVNHLDIINFTNRVEYAIMSLWDEEPKFNAVALYLHIADMLAKEGL